MRSVERACHEIRADAYISPDPDRIRKADRIIFPGVGIAGAAMRSITERGIDQALLEAFSQGTPILGICIGLQISLDFSEEGDIKTLGLVPGRVRRFKMQDPALKVPHMGWNEVTLTQDHPVTCHIKAGDEFYFVHAYFPDPQDEDAIYARAEYESSFCCAIGKQNFFGTQFHPEKSGRVGLQLIKNFCEWDGQRA